MQHGTFSVPGTEARNSDTDGHGNALGRSPRQDAAHPKKYDGTATKAAPPGKNEFGLSNYLCNLS